MKVININDKQYPKNLLKIKRPPKTLYVIGNEKLLNNNSIAIVGSRKCSFYGIKHAKEFSKALADKNITIISGLALGIDTIAHETAQKCKGKTIAVLGCGLNNIYPKQNEELFKQILENDGCIISEYEPEEKIDMKNFAQRNRIISGIADAVLVIEATNRSGSTITGRLGLEQGKNVYCLPRDLGNLKGAGTNHLIQKGAQLVIEPKDILEQFGIENEKMPKILGYKTKNIKQNQMPQEYKKIYDYISYIPQNIQFISRRSGITISEVTQKLIILELQGYIKSMPGNFYVKT